MTYADSDLLKAVQTLLAQTQKGALDWTEIQSQDPRNALCCRATRQHIQLQSSRRGGLMLAILSTSGAEENIIVSTENTTPEIAESFERLYEVAAEAVKKPRTVIDTLLEDLGGQHDPNDDVRPPGHVD